MHLEYVASLRPRHAQGVQRLDAIREDNHVLTILRVNAVYDRVDETDLLFARVVVHNVPLHERIQIRRVLRDRVLVHEDKLALGGELGLQYLVARRVMRELKVLHDTREHAMRHSRLVDITLRRVHRGSPLHERAVVLLQLFDDVRGRPGREHAHHVEVLLRAVVDRRPRQKDAEASDGLVDRVEDLRLVRQVQVRLVHHDDGVLVHRDGILAHSEHVYPDYRDASTLRRALRHVRPQVALAQHREHIQVQQVIELLDLALPLNDQRARAHYDAVDPLDRRHVYGEGDERGERLAHPHAVRQERSVAVLQPSDDNAKCIALMLLEH